MGGAWDWVKGAAGTGANIMTGGMGGQAMNMLGGHAGAPAPQQNPQPAQGYPQTQTNSYPGWPVPQQPGPRPEYNFQGDLSGPGAAESFFSQNQNKFTQPTQSGNFWQQNQQRFGAPGQGDQFWNQAQGMFNEHKAAGPPSNNANAAYQQFQGSAPANTDPYYQHAMDEGTRRLEASQAANHLAGSSVASQQVGDLNAGLLGQQALANANYGLQRGQIAGQLGSAADASSRGQSQDQLGWLGGLGNLALGTQNANNQSLNTGMNAAGQADQMGLAGLMSGMSSAGQAQNALQGRSQGFLNNLMGLGGQESGILGQTFGAGLQNDQNLMDAQQQAYLGYPREQLNESMQGRQNTEAGLGNLMGMMGSFKDMGGVGGLAGLIG